MGRLGGTAVLLARRALPRTPTSTALADARSGEASCHENGPRPSGQGPSSSLSQRVSGRGLESPSRKPLTCANAPLSTDRSVVARRSEPQKANLSTRCSHGNTVLMSGVVQALGSGRVLD